MLASLERHYGPLERRSTIANGRRADRFAPRRKEPFVFSAGRVWDGAKNVESVVAVAQSVPWPIAIAGGDGFGGNTARERRPGVRFLGSLSEEQMAEWLGRAAIFALPARYEPFGLLPLEAALSGCALVLGDIPSLREVWGDAADYVDPADPEALRLAIRRLTSSPADLQRRAAAARSRAADYPAERMAAGYLDLYRTVIANHPTGVRCAS
jgi:glycosyltransferase involved in cell wall biosynthesis